ncbi:MAG: NADH-quinone oxidoreductase subunit [Gammaproteobacteria bacterium]|jgi:NADH-quinone oxidoreductase subunit M|nr:NADH-quinone oxidoreductase subunit [Gammaproteobacteria bacterium]HWM65182.1 NADH-quinone oxidoreductase subunit M [Steroidobacteraceae bacterium]
MFPYLSILIWLPIAAGIVVLLLGDKNIGAARWVALLAAVATLIITLPLVAHFNSGTADFQFVEKIGWIARFHSYYALGLDGISMPLVVLTAFITIPVIIAAWTVIEARPAQYYAAFLIMEGLMIGVFSATDALLFYFFWEAMLIPMFLIIGIWGGPRRVYATIKFFLYTFLGSVFMLVALIYMYVKAGDYSIASFQSLPLTLIEQRYIFIAFFLAFAVKVPMWPVHTWLPDAHVEAPTGGSVILAAIMLKMGGYGFLRFNLPITPDASRELDLFIIALSLIAVVYIGFVALVQQDMKKLIAYSSIAHMGFVTLGAFLVYQIVRNTGGLQGAGMGMDGAMVQMISHGLVSGALFLCVGVLYDRTHSRQIADYGGVINSMPIFAAFMVLFALANTGLPGTSGFVGEFLVILASFKASFWYSLLAATTLVLSAAYSLWLVKRVVFGPVGNAKVAALTDLNGREFGILAVLAVAVLLVGCWPAPILKVMQPTIHHLVDQAVASKIPV